MSAPAPTLESPKDAARRLAASALRDGYRPEALHEYCDAAGRPLFWRIRLKHPDGRKWIRPMRQSSPGGFELGEPEFPAGKPLYRLPEIAKTDADLPVLVVEGELCADALAQRGLVATTSGGASSASSADWSPLTGRQVILWPDLDDPGAQYTVDVVTRLRGIAARVEIFDVRNLGLPAHGDAVDWLYEYPDATGADVLGLSVVPAPETANTPDVHSHEPAQRWPDDLDPAALHGLAGEIVHTLEPHTEADPAAMLLQFLAAFGVAVGPGPHYLIEGDRHCALVWLVLVGETSKARKGTSWGRIRALFEVADPSFISERVMRGLSSGEGLIWAVRDPITKREKTKESGVFDEVEVDAGVVDKRLLVFESEFASVLRVMARQGSTLSPTLRSAWDSGALRIMTKNSPAIATGAHIGTVGHVTVDEMRRYLDRTEAASGFANRFLYCAVRRSKCLPDGGNLDEKGVADLGRKVEAALKAARQIERITMTEEARVLWHRVYPELSEGLPGLLGAVTGRAEAQTIRLGLLYALLDGSHRIEAAHLTAALAVWERCEASARYVFGSAVGDPVADEILRAMKVAGSAGMTRTEIRDLFKRHRGADEIERALVLLRNHKLARIKRQAVKGPGRPVEVWFTM